jgi:hypothetical protein
LAGGFEQAEADRLNPFVMSGYLKTGVLMPYSCPLPFNMSDFQREAAALGKV